VTQRREVVCICEPEVGKILSDEEEKEIKQRSHRTTRRAVMKFQISRWEMR
jgi:hypothetical protein